MPVNIPRLRYWFAAAAIFTVVIVAGFYFYARYRFYRAVKEVPQKLGVEIQQSTDTFSLSKSEGGHTIFTIKASKAVQYKQGGRAELHDVTIVVYGRESNRFDQIYGSDFLYDPQTGNVVAQGEVNIDLEANPVGAGATNQTPPAELKNPIHLKTSGLAFNKDSGLAKTDQRVDFSIPQAQGSAIGADYDSKSNLLILHSDVQLDMSGSSAMKVTARHGVISKQPRQAVLDGVHAQRANDKMAADKVVFFLRPDNTIEHVQANGNVEATATGATNMIARSPAAEFYLSGKNVMQSAVMTGGVAVESTGAHAMTGQAGRVTMDFGDDSKLVKVRATEGVHLLQKAGAQAQALSNGPKLVRAAKTGGPGRPQAKTAGNSQHSDTELTADAMDFYVQQGKTLERAETFGKAQIVITPEQQPNSQQGPTVITAGKFTSRFNDSRLSSIHGAPNARVVQSTPGQPDKVSTSDTVDATLTPAGNVNGFVQQGNFQYHEALRGANTERSAWADKASYDSISEILTLTGSPRVAQGGMTTTAHEVRISRHSGDAVANGEVKTTYSELQAQPNGAMLASSDPVHVTAATMNLNRATGVARYAGDARLWQASNIIQAPIIFFDRDRRSVDAQAPRGQQVGTVLVQQDKNGKMTPVNVTSARLIYNDLLRTARFEGGVVMRGTEGTVTSENASVYLKPQSAAKTKSGTDAKSISVPAATPARPVSTLPGVSPGQVDRIVAEGHVVVQQPVRRATGEKLVYTADDAKFVMTGGPPSVWDAERGTITGTSLTFYSHDDRVLVESGGHGRTVTTTRVSK